MPRSRSPVEAPLWIVSLLGVCLTSFGIYIQVTSKGAWALVAAGSLAAVGGGVIGAVISIYVASGEGRDALRSVRDVLAGSLRARMLSAESDLRPLRKPWQSFRAKLTIFPSTVPGGPGAAGEAGGTAVDRPAPGA